MNAQHSISVRLSVMTVALLGALVLAACSSAEPAEPTLAAAAEQQAVEVCIDEGTGT